MKLRVLTIALALFVALPAFAHHDPTGMQITTKSPQAHVYFERGLRKMELLHFEAGLENWRKAVAADPHFALAHIFLNFFSQDPSEQVAEREKALATRQYAGPEEQLIIDWLANASESNWIPAIQAMNGALERYPQDKYLAWMAGWWLALAQNQSPRALAMFERVIRIDPAFADAWNEAAYCYAKAGNFDKAFADIRRYTQLVPNEPNPQDSFAELSRMAGHFDDALKHYRMSLKIDPSFHESQLGLGDTYALMGDQAKARAEYEIAIQQATPVQKVMWGLQWAATYVREGDTDGADQAFQKVAKQARGLDFANYEAEAYRSMALYQKDSATAFELLARAETVLHEDHKVPQSLLNEELAAVWRAETERAVKDGNLYQAKVTLSKLEQMSGSTGDVLVEVAHHGAAGAVALAEGNYDQAIGYLEDDSTNPISMRELVVAYERSGQKENSAHMSAALAALNVPIIEQALVVPDFRRQRADARVPRNNSF
jgi:tetratricopeptide (TPR) repeat protein